MIYLLSICNWFENFVFCESVSTNIYINYFVKGYTRQSMWTLRWRSLQPKHLPHFLLPKVCLQWEHRFKCNRKLWRRVHYGEMFALHLQHNRQQLWALHGQLLGQCVDLPEVFLLWMLTIGHLFEWGGSAQTMRPRGRPLSMQTKCQKPWLQWVPRWLLEH